MTIVIPRRPKEDRPPWEPDFKLDGMGFVEGGAKKWWTEILTYPALDEKVRAVKIYRTKHDEYIPLQYSIVTTSRYDNSYAWPIHVAIREELHNRFGTIKAIRFGIRPSEDEPVSEWKKLGDFPTFRDHHIHLGNPSYVIMSRDWVPVVRGRRQRH